MKTQWADLNALRVPDDYEAPEDIAAIKWASAHMGDYKLKTSDEYLGEKITTAKRRQRVLDLKQRVRRFSKMHSKKVILIVHNPWIGNSRFTTKL